MISRRRSLEKIEGSKVDLEMADFGCLDSRPSKPVSPLTRQTQQQGEAFICLAMVQQGAARYAEGSSWQI